VGHTLFVALHVIALLFFLPALFVTIPLHVIYAFVASKDNEARQLATMLRPCPMCAEQIQRAAIVCKHCGHRFGPSSDSSDEARTRRLAEALSAASPPDQKPRPSK